MLAVDLWISLASSIFPRVEDPWPDSIDLGFPFMLAGAGSILAGVVYAEASQSKRDRIINKAGVYGFRLGVLVYALSLLVQVVSEI